MVTIEQEKQWYTFSGVLLGQHFLRMGIILINPPNVPLHALYIDSSFECDFISKRLKRQGHLLRFW